LEGPQADHPSQSTRRGAHPEISNRGVRRARRNGQGSVGVECSNSRSMVEGVAIHSSRGKGTTRQHYYIGDGGDQ